MLYQIQVIMVMSGLAICCPVEDRSSCSSCWLLTCDCISYSITSPLLLQLLRRLLLYGGRWFFLLPTFVCTTSQSSSDDLLSDSLDDEWATFFGNGTNFFGCIFAQEERGGGGGCRAQGPAWWRPIGRRGLQPLQRLTHHDVPCSKNLVSGKSSLGLKVFPLSCSG